MTILPLDFLQNVVAGLVGAVIAYLYSRLSAFIRDLLFKRKISLAGEYISYFYDTQNDKRVESVASARFKQHINLLKGTSELVPYCSGRERQWNLSGEIIDQRNILGNYVCTTPLQSGMGTFSLRIMNHGLLSGHWSGYDSDNNIMNYGEYVFKRILDFRTEPPKKRDWPVIIRICSEVMGKNYIDSLNRDTLRFYVARYKQHGVIGFVALEVLASGDITKVYPQIETQQLPPALQYCDKYGLVRSIKTLAIDPKFQGRGIGTKLFCLAEAKCIDSETNAILVPAWKQRDTNNIKNILEGRSFTVIGEIKDYWKADCEKGAFQCPAKHQQSLCACSLVLHWKLVSR